MGTFPNGTAGEIFQEQWCARCVHFADKDDGRGPGCPVIDAHLAFDYGAEGDTRRALDMLIADGDCLMFHEGRPPAPPPLIIPGAERWGDLRWARDVGKSLAFVDPAESGWWWSNGHIALRCDGRSPPDAAAPVGEPTVSALAGRARRAVVKAWGAPATGGRVVTHSPVGRPAFCLDARYIEIVERGVMGVARWMTGNTTKDGPALAYEGDRLMALVMPVGAT